MQNKIYIDLVISFLENKYLELLIVLVYIAHLLHVLNEILKESIMLKGNLLNFLKTENSSDTKKVHKNNRRKDGWNKKSPKI
ncbi:hypothetical protein ACTQXV_01075 [Ligilactobacillus salivarius]|uniref:hypothetical protein n=1 Tax=Ligilactobacillus salivarius TaxID=1624 RepID=UPI0018746FBB|nr:hypothetical protein [Ligilactobacillus salivarius]MBE5067169.1 hypothetical protein [Ligilactobacillus salivarius]